MYLLKVRYLLLAIVSWPFVLHIWRHFNPKVEDTSTRTTTTQTTTQHNTTQHNTVDSSTQTEEGLSNFIIVEYCSRV